jgi:Flp pilus assembly protein TadG
MTRDCRGDPPRTESGSFTVELVLLVPVLMLFVLFVVTLGRYELAREQVIGAARAAAEAASVVASATQAQPAANSAAALGIQGLGHMCARLGVETDTSGFVPGGDVRVTVSCQVDFSDLSMPGFPGSTTVRSVQVAPVDPYRAVQ